MVNKSNQEKLIKYREELNKLWHQRLFDSLNNRDFGIESTNRINELNDLIKSLMTKYLVSFEAKEYHNNVPVITLYKQHIYLNSDIEINTEVKWPTNSEHFDELIKELYNHILHFITSDFTITSIKKQ